MAEKKKKRIKAPKAPETKSPGFKGQELFYEFKGNPEFSSPSDVAKIQEEFIKYATDPKRANVTWITRSKGMGKNKDQLYSKGIKGVYPQGALGGKFGESHNVKLPDKSVISVYVPNVKASKEAFAEKSATTKSFPKSNPKLMKPRSDLGSIIVNAAENFNKKLRTTLTSESIPFKNAKGGQKWRNEEYQKRKIKIKPFVVEGKQVQVFKDQGMDNNAAFKAASEAREAAIASISDKQVVVTASAEFEQANERKARGIYEELQQMRKNAGFKSKKFSDKITDEFIDEVNTTIDGKPKYSWDLKEGALKFLQNKEKAWLQSFESASEETRILNEQRLEDTRLWSGKTTLTDHFSENITEQSSAITGDYAYQSDTMAEGFPEDRKAPVPISTSGEELGYIGDPKAGTKNLLTGKIPTSDITSSYSRVVQEGGGEKIDAVKSLIYGDFDDDIASQTIKRPESVDAQGNAAKGSGFNFSSQNYDLKDQLAMSEDFVNMEKVAREQGWGEYGATINKGNRLGYGPLQSKQNTNLVESGINKGLTKESSLKRGKSIITSAFADLEGSTYDEIKSPSEVRSPVTAGSGNVYGPKVQQITIPGNVEEVYSGTRVINKVAKPTRDQVTRMQIYENIPPNAAAALKSAYPAVRNEKIKEYNKRVKAGEQKKFIKDIQAKNNALLKAPAIANAGVQSNTAEAMLNPNANKPTPTNDPVATVKRDKIISGDIWEQEGYKVVSTNLGGVHGRGLAKQAADMGLITPGHKSFVTSPVIEAKGDPKFNSGVITIAVKGAAPETAKIPGKAFSESTTAGNVKLMQSEVDKLINFARKNPTEKINLPFIGLGFGEGDPKVIKPILAKAAQEPNIYLVSKDDATVTKYKETFKPGVRSDGTSRKSVAPQPKADIELKQSSVLTKQSGTPTFTTKGQKTKTAVKTGAKKILTGPGSTTLNALSAFSMLSPFIGAFGEVVQEQKRQEKKEAALPLYPAKKKSLLTRFRNMDSRDYSQALMHRMMPSEVYGKEGYAPLKDAKKMRKNTNLQKSI